MQRRCPICQKPIPKDTDTEKKTRSVSPFCSQRCQLVDLGAWLNADYRIAAPQAEGYDDEEMADDDLG